MSTFVIVDQSKVDRHRERMMVAGMQADNFLNSPVLFWNHHRSKTYNDAASMYVMPLGRWENLRTEGDLILADAVFDLGDEKGAELARKVEEGFVHAASVGYKAIAWDESPEMMLPSQYWPTITEWELLEISVVDIPSNPGAVIQQKNAPLDMNSIRYMDAKVYQSTKKFYDMGFWDLIKKKNWKITKDDGKELTEEEAKSMDSEFTPDTKATEELIEKKVSDLLEKATDTITDVFAEKIKEVNTAVEGQKTSIDNIKAEVAKIKGKPLDSEKPSDGDNPAASPVTTSEKSANAEAQIKVLDRMKKKGLISEENYKKRVAELKGE